MPRVPKPKRPSARSDTSSTVYRREQIRFLDQFGEVMPIACLNCMLDGVANECRIHPRSGRCNNCHRKNSQDCNIRITEEEWQELLQEKRRLQERELALRRERLRLDEESLVIEQDKRRLEQRAAQVIHITERNLLCSEQRERALDKPTSPRDSVMASSSVPLSPFTHAVMNGFSDDIFTADPPGYLGSPVRGSGGTSARAPDSFEDFS